jgi:hypothetical protein
MRAIASWNAPTIFAPAGDNFAGAAEEGARLADRLRGFADSFSFLDGFSLMIGILPHGGRRGGVGSHRDGDFEGFWHLTFAVGMMLEP